MTTTETLTLDQLPSGTEAVITAIRGQGAIRQKFFDMGFIPGVTIEKVRAAPLRDPVQVTLLGYSVALRRHEAEMIQVQI